MMRISNGWHGGLTLAGALFSAAGCVQGPDDMAIDERGNEEEAVGEAQQALGGEAGCATVALGSIFGAAATITSTAATYTLQSPNDKYDPGSTCSNQWIAEFSGWNTIAGQAHGIEVNWGQPMAYTAATCSNSRLRVYFYGYNGSWNTTPTGFRIYQGSWSGGVCNWSLASSSGAEPSHTNTKIRVVVHGFEYVADLVAGTGTLPDFKNVFVRAYPIPE